MASPEFGIIRLEASPDVRHAFVSTQPQSSNSALVSSNAWNAKLNAPPYTVFELPPGLVWESQPSGLTRLLDAPSLYQRANLANAESVRLVVPVLVAGAASAVLRGQYTTDLTGASGWAYLDGSAGPSVSIATVGNQASTIVALVSAAKADVLLRIVGLVP